MNEKALRVRYQKNKVKKERWKMYDVIIIGAGVSGAAAARELSRKSMCDRERGRCLLRHIQGKQCNRTCGI